MAGAPVALPEGFVLDSAPARPQPPALPPGFELDGGDSGIPADFKGLVVPVTPRSKPKPRPPAAPQKDFAGVDPGTVVPGVQTADEGQAQPGDTPGPQPSTAEALGRGALAGATMNWSDELAGLNAASGMKGADTSMGLVPLAVGAGKMIRAKTYEGGGDSDTLRTIAGAMSGGMTPEEYLPPPGQKGPDLSTPEDQAALEAYQAGLYKERGANEAARAAHPGAFITGEIGASIASAPFLPAMAPLKVAKGAGLINRAAKGVANAATAGAGYGAIAGAGGADEGDRLEGARKGAEMGAVLAPALTAGLRTVGATAGAIGKRATALTNPGKIGDRALAQAVERDAIDLPAAANQIEAANAQGQPLTLADIGGKNVKGIVGTASRTPGRAAEETRAFLDTRQGGSETGTAPGQGERIEKGLTDFVGADAGTLATAKRITSTREAKAGPLYAAARRAVIPDNAIPVDLLRRLKAAGALGAAIKKAQIEGKPFEINRVEAWDRMKRALDDRIGAFKRKGAKDDARIYTALKRELTDAVDAAVPVYAAARKVFAGHSEFADALEAGRSAFRPSTSVEELAADFHALTPGEQELFRLGAVNALKDRLGDIADTADKARFLANPKTRRKFEIIAPDEASKEALLRHLRQERAMFDTRAKTLGNSATPERLTHDAETIGQITEASHAVSGWKSALIYVARQTARLDPAKRGAVMMAIRDIALNPNAETVRAFAERISRTEMKDGTRQRIVAAVVKALPRALITDAAGRRGDRTDRLSISQ
jgi:hypothetical protein